MSEELYGLDPSFERAVALMCAYRPKFMALIAHALDPKAMSTPLYSLIVKGCQAIFRDVGTGPVNPAILLQRLRRWMNEGSVTKEEIDEVIDFFVSADENLLPADRAVVAELAPVLKRRVQAQVVREAMDDFQNRRDFSRIVKMINAADRLGQHDESLGLRLSPDAFGEIAKMRHVEQLTFGIPELDAMLNGGPPRGTQTVFVSGYGGGKSMCMSHATAWNASLGLFVGYITLELPEPVVMARVVSNLTLIPVHEILSNAKIEAKAKKKITEMFPILGDVIVKEMAPGSTTMLDVREWVKQCEEDVGRSMDILVLDYADKLKSHNRNDRDTYNSMNTVYEDFRFFMHESKKWGITASQARRKSDKDKNRTIETDDVADSVNKLRVTDLGITITANLDEETARYKVGKYRYGKAGGEVGPLPTDWAHGRMVPGGIYDSLVDVIT